MFDRRFDTPEAAAGRVAASVAAVARHAQRAVWPVVDLLIRLFLAQLFWMHGIAGALDWQAALRQAAVLTRDFAMHPAHAATLMTGANLLLPPLLALGLGTRLVSLPLLLLSLASYRAAPADAAPLLWALLAAWYAVVGAGPVSLDAPLARGIYRSALPLARGAGRALAWVTRAGRPVLLLAVRAGIAAILLRPVMQGAGAGPVLGVLLVVGLATRLATLPLLLAAGAQTMHAATGEHLCWVLVLLLLAASGPGELSLDHLIGSGLRRRWAARRGAARDESEAWPHVVIVGGGFGGLAAARGLRFAACRITLIDQRNYHLFQPLLYQVATASLSPADIATPIRALFRDQDNLRVLLGAVTGVDRAGRAVLLDDGSRIAYDTLVLATGARHAYFGHDDWEAYAPGLKTVEDATEIRRRVLLAFEHAEATDDPGARQALLTFAVIGGGPTGVELAGSIAELARHGLAGEFRAIDPAQARVLLVQATDRILPTFPPELSQAAAESLRELGVELRLNAAVDGVDPHGISIGGMRIACRTAFWAAGVAASPAAAWLGAPSDRAGRLIVGDDLTLAGAPEIFALGDTVAVNAWDGKPVPGLAPAAKQGGAYVARVIRARLAGRAAPGPFRYHHGGSLATIGRRAAVVDFGRVRLHGALAWWLWGAVHILFLAGTRNRLVVGVQWFWAYLTFGRGIRLITGATDKTAAPAA